MAGSGRSSVDDPCPGLCLAQAPRPPRNCWRSIGWPCRAGATSRRSVQRHSSNTSVTAGRSARPSRLHRGVDCWCVPRGRPPSETRLTWKFRSLRARSESSKGSKSAFSAALIQARANFERRRSVSVEAREGTSLSRAMTGAIPRPRSVSIQFVSASPSASAAASFPRRRAERPVLRRDGSSRRRGHGEFPSSRSPSDRPHLGPLDPLRALRAGARKRRRPPCPLARLLDSDPRVPSKMPPRFIKNFCTSRRRSGREPKLVSPRSRSIRLGRRGARR